MFSVFLIGGGWQAQEETFGRFVEAATVGAKRRIVLILLEEVETDKVEVGAKYRSTFFDLGVTDQQLEIVWISQDSPLSLKKLKEYSPTGIFVGGGTTPLYQEVLYKNTAWVDYMHKRKLPYGGFSAGAAIAADKALVGGWKLRLQTQEVPIVDEECSEGLEWLTVNKGLGLVQFSIDVHATQWGNLARMIHAVEQQQVEMGWAIDEDTLMQVEGNRVQVWGSGQVYRVARVGEGQIQLDILRAGEQYFM